MANDTRNEATDRTKAIEWWISLRFTEKAVEMNKFGIEPHRSSTSLTGREVEEIWCAKFKKIMSKREMVLEQIGLKDEMLQKSGINIVTCGNCGDIVLHRLMDEEIKCPYCGFESEPCDFPDFLYTGCELSAVYDEDEEDGGWE